MSIYKRRGQYAVAIDLPAGLDGKRRRRYVGGTFKTKKAAEIAERQAELERDHGIGIEAERLSVDGLIERYITHREARCTRGTVKRYRELKTLYICKYVGTVGIKNLSPLAITQMYAKLTETLSQQSVLHIHRLFKGAFKWAVAMNLLVRSPFESVETPIVPKRETRALTPEEARRLLDAALGRRSYSWFLFALLTGARQGEVAALSWADVDLERGIVTIRSSYSERTGETVLKCTKSGRARTFALSPRAIDLLRKQRALIAHEKLFCPPGGYSDEYDLVFPDPTGRPTRLHAFRDAFTSVARVAGVRNASFHTLRHSSATWMLGQGADIHSVQAVLGHSVPSTTLNIYGHAIADLQARAVAAIDATLDAGFTARRGA